MRAFSRKFHSTTYIVQTAEFIYKTTHSVSLGSPAKIGEPDNTNSDKINIFCYFGHYVGSQFKRSKVKN